MVTRHPNLIWVLFRDLHPFTLIPLKLSCNDRFSAGVAIATYTEGSWRKREGGNSKRTVNVHGTSWSSEKPVQLYIRSADVGKIIGREISCNSTY